MEQSKYTSPRKRSQYQSIDGFVAPKPTSSTASSATPLPASPQAPQARPVPAPKAMVAPDPSLNSLSQKRRYFGGDDQADASAKTGSKPRSRKKKIILRTSLAIVSLVLIIGGTLGFKTLDTLNKVFHGNIVSDVKAITSHTTLKGEAQGRVNILLAGDSSDDPGHEGADLTDSIMVLSIDTQNNTGFMLSIPRDLWVDVPTLGYQKINSANTVTNLDQSGYPNNGMGTLSYIVQTDLGIPIDYYSLIDYGAFKDAVDAVGGITIDIQSPDPRGLYDPNTSIKLPNGEVTLNGQEALNLARARGDGYGSYGFPNSDFDRTQYQREMLVAVAQKAKTLGVISNPLKVNDLFNSLGNNLHTDLSLSDVLSFIQLAKNINISSLQSVTYSLTGSNPLLENYTDPASGEEALAPSAGLGNYGQLQNYYKQLTSSNPIIKEDATVEVLNASDVDGLAHQEATKLANSGFDVVGVTDANNEYPSTMVVDNSSGAMPAAASYLKKAFPGTVTTSSSSSTEAGEAQGYTADFVVILGQNWDNTVVTDP